MWRGVGGVGSRQRLRGGFTGRGCTVLRCFVELVACACACASYGNLNLLRRALSWTHLSEK